MVLITTRGTEQEARRIEIFLAQRKIPAWAESTGNLPIGHPGRAEVIGIFVPQNYAEFALDLIEMEGLR